MSNISASISYLVSEISVPTEGTGSAHQISFEEQTMEKVDRMGFWKPIPIHTKHLVCLLMILMCRIDYFSMNIQPDR